MSTLCTRTLVACPLRSTGITPGFSVCSCSSCEALGYRGDPQCSQCGGRGRLFVRKGRPWIVSERTSLWMPASPTGAEMSGTLHSMLLHAPAQRKLASLAVSMKACTGASAHLIAAERFMPRPWWWIGCRDPFVSGPRHQILLLLRAGPVSLHFYA